jgi:hypothetical protein
MKAKIILLACIFLMGSFWAENATANSTNSSSNTGWFGINFPSVNLPSVDLPGLVSSALAMPIWGKVAVAVMLIAGGFLAEQVGKFLKFALIGLGVLLILLVFISFVR